MRTIEIQFPDGERRSRAWLDDNPEKAQPLLAHCQGRYPLCLCRSPGQPLYVAMRSRYYLARLPNTGPAHAPQCPSYEPDPNQCGRGIYSTRAMEDRTDGRMHVKLGVPLMIRGPSSGITAPNPSPTALERGVRETLELRGLLHLLWDRAEFNRWHPAMQSRRRYRQVRKYIWEAAENIAVRRKTLTRHLYIPEPFRPEHALEIEARRQRAWRERSQTSSGLPLRILVLGRVRAIVETEQITGLRLAHLRNELILRADQACLMRLKQLSEFAWIDWPTLNPEFHLIVLLTLQRTARGNWKVDAATAMVCTEDYIPVLSIEEAILAKRLVSEQRSFIKPLPYDGTEIRYPNFLLTDCGTQALPLEIIVDNEAEAVARHQRIAEYMNEKRVHWLWDLQNGALPPALPELEK